MNTSKIHIALPVLNESKNLPAFIACLKAQSMQDFSLLVCVNQYEAWWDDAEKVDQCIDNQKSIDFLQSVSGMGIQIIDKSSKGKGWPRKKGGVGHARKIIMDLIVETATDHDLIVSMDADTFYPPDYLASLQATFQQHPRQIGLAVPYYHKLDGNETDRLILRYEIYMRYYALNMLRINNPYAFTALGSAMAFPVWAYKKVGGLTPVLSGEDFYFLQKLSKNGTIGLWAETKAFPSSRFSDRVLFGTGPALIKGNIGNWDSYPIYDYHLFDEVAETFRLFPSLYQEDLQTPMDAFLKKQFNTDIIWEPLRKNYKDVNNFVKACVNKVDGLRILQFLRQERSKTVLNNADMLIRFLKKYHGSKSGRNFVEKFDGMDFETSTVEKLNQIRDFLFGEEMRLRQLKQ
jgi:glycosyltransferase involved in cell wall biosynthesis